MDEDWGSSNPHLGGGGSSSNKKNKDGGFEVDYKTKSGTAWSHNYLNQKPWHPLSYPNQRRKWIAEQTHAQRQRRSEEISREFAQEQEFFRQTALVSKKEKEKMEMMKAVSFMYVRPPGYNAESAKAAEIADEKKQTEQTSGTSQQSAVPPNIPEVPKGKDPVQEDKKKNKPKDVFGRALPSEEDFEVLKNAPRLETGAPVRIKPFAVEIRNVRCVRCGTYGHQSGDRECPLKDVIMPNDESRLKRDDPLSAIMAHADSTEPRKWELKQRPGMSPPRGGFMPDDPNQQIVPEDIFDEYGGFLGDGGIPALLTNISAKKIKKHSGRKRRNNRHSSASDKKIKDHETSSSSTTDTEERRKSRRKHVKRRYSEAYVTSEASSEEHQMNPERAKRTAKYHRDLNHDETHSARHYHRTRSVSPSSDSESNVRMRKFKEKHRDRKKRYYYSGSDYGSENEELKRRTKGKRRHHSSDLSSASADDRRSRRSSQRKH